MLFNSLEFLFFFIGVTALYFALPYRYRWVLLLISSCYFYMAFVPVYILILAGTIIIDYFAGIYIEKAQGKRRKAFLIASLIANIGVLAVFKYYNFFNHNLSVALDGMGMSNYLPFLSILLPIGLSFHTFQAMSYTIEVYRGNQKAEKHFGIYSLYVMFYPQLVAGPIERPQNLLPQFREKFDFDYGRVTSGLRLMLWGLFKKVVIADRLSVLVNAVYESPEAYNSYNLVLATVFFSFQILCDFSGYSDMAIGAARVMGFKLMTNFNRPYQSRNIHEFWKRWHISLSTWFKDYLYISLGGNRVSIPRWYLNLFIVFIISGFWHGANWTFIAWGALHGFYLVFALATERIRNRINRSLRLDKIQFVQVLITFGLVSFAWIFFRAENLNTALYISKKIFTGLPDIYHQLRTHQSITQPTGVSPRDLSISVFFILVLIAVHFWQQKMNVSEFFKSRPVYVRWFAYLVIVFSILIFGEFENRQFIYFQF